MTHTSNRRLKQISKILSNQVWIVRVRCQKYEDTCYLGASPEVQMRQVGAIYCCVLKRLISHIAAVTQIQVSHTQIGWFSSPSCHQGTCSSNISAACKFKNNYICLKLAPNLHDEWHIHIQYLLQAYFLPNFMESHRVTWLRCIEFFLGIIEFFRLKPSVFFPISMTFCQNNLIFIK